MIDDEKGETLVACSDQELKSKIKNLPRTETKFLVRGQKPKIQIKKKKIKEKEEVSRIRKIAVAYEVGKLIAEKALKKKVEKVIFDRGGYQYHGRIKSLAEGAREGGLRF